MQFEMKVKRHLLERVFFRHASSNSTDGERNIQSTVFVLFGVFRYSKTSTVSPKRPFWYILWGWVNKASLKETILQPVHYTNPNTFKDPDEKKNKERRRIHFCKGPLLEGSLWFSILLVHPNISLPPNVHPNGSWCCWGVGGFAQGKISIIPPPPCFSCLAEE